MTLSDQAKDDIRWGMSNKTKIFRNMVVNKPVLMLYSDASHLGWGAHFSGMATRGRWPDIEAGNYIN